MERSPLWARSCALTGVGLLLTAAIAQLVGAIRHRPIEIPHTVFYVAGVIGFVGFYGMSPSRAKDGGNFLVTQFVRVAGVLRLGRRSTDIAVVTEPLPDASELLPPTGEDE